MADSPRKRNFVLRTISGSVVVLGVLGGIYKGGMVWSVIVGLLALLSLSEYYRMLSGPYKISRGVGYLCSIFAILSSSTEGIYPVSIAFTLSIAVYVIMMIEMVRRQIGGISFAVWNVGLTLSGVLFIVLPWTCTILLRSMPNGVLLLVSLFACTWSCDVMAYLVGSQWGHNKLCESISPNKTWEGFIGGFVGSVLMIAIIIYALKQPAYPLIFIGLICGLAGQLGDLSESLIKRETGVKDAGNIIPGHGGVLDRFDSILISSLLTYLLFGAILQ